jgi:hypothetical protein
MSQPPARESQGWAAPRFYVTPRPRFNPVPFLLALLLAAGGLFAVLYALNRSGHTHLFPVASKTSRSGASGSAGDAADNDNNDDDPSSVDTIYLGDPAEAPTATRPAANPTADPNANPSTVHPFQVINLPRSGSQVGQIPATPAGHLLYNWLAAFNSTDQSAVASALQTPELGQTGAAQRELRRQTGGFTLVSAKEVQPGLLVFRLHDQTAAATEFLGTLQVRQNSSPPNIASFSLSAVPQTQASAR